MAHFTDQVKERTDSKDCIIHQFAFDTFDMNDTCISIHPNGDKYFNFHIYVRPNVKVDSEGISRSTIAIRGNIRLILLGEDYSQLWFFDHKIYFMAGESASNDKQHHNDIPAIYDKVKLFRIEVESEPAIYQ
jgi:hypothetical protein